MSLARWLHGKNNRAQRQSRQHRARLVIEEFESRLVPSVWKV
jgi:hypothetical protein